MSWIGPVFDFELITTARRTRYFILRFVYGLALLFMVFTIYQSYNYRLVGGQRELSIDDMSSFAYSTFSGFAWIQFFSVIFLTPALVAGTIADEKQRKTLHYLLSSRLSGAEIILGKLGARLLNLLTILLLGLPVVSLLTLFGGVDPWILLAVYVETFFSVFFLASLSIWVSVQSKKPREAVSLMYLFTAVWLVGFQIVLVTMPSADEPIKSIWGYIEPWYEWVAMCSPAYLVHPRRFSTASMVASLPWIVGSQFVYGTFYLLLSIFQLRRTYAKQDDQGSRLRKVRERLLGKRSWLPRPACGDDAMLWKEFFVAKSGGLSKVTGLILAIGIVGLILYSGFDLVKDAFRELMVSGWTGTLTSARTDLNIFIRGVNTALFVLWLLGICATSSSLIASEREEDTWITLISTPLERDDILRPKFLAAFWAMKPVLLMILGLWGVGLVLGGLHPIGLVLGLISLITFSWFFVALGLSFSLALSTSTRAQASTLMLMILLSGGYLFCCIPFRPNTALVFAISSPFTFFWSQVSWEEFWSAFGRSSNRFGYRGGDVAEVIFGSIFCLIGYGVGAALLTHRLSMVFDRAVGRPDRMAQLDDLSPAALTARRAAMLARRDAMVAQADETNSDSDDESEA